MPKSCKYIFFFVVLDGIVGHAHLRTLTLRDAVLGISSNNAALHNGFGVESQRRQPHASIPLHDAITSI